MEADSADQIPEGPEGSEPLKPELVVEVQYDYFTGGPFRHGTKLIRFRARQGA